MNAPAFKIQQAVKLIMQSESLLQLTQARREGFKLLSD
jgi:hypothetical protein